MSNLRLPPLNTLKVFATVARTQSVTRAAEALHLTHGAVSHQLRQLQEELGVALVERAGRGLRLTNEGAAYAARVEKALTDIADATRQLTATRHMRTLRVSSISSFAGRWLLPRMGTFICRHPEFDLEVQSTARLADVKGGEVDVALRHGLGRYPGVYAERMLEDWFYPVCSPDFLKQYPLNQATDLLNVPLLRSTDEPWMLWFAAVGLNAPEPTRGPAYSDSGLMMMAAAGGQGVALARHSLVADDIATGRLVQPFGEVMESPFAYHFVCRLDEVDKPEIAQLHQWLREEVAAFPRPAGEVRPSPISHEAAAALLLQR